MKRILVISWFYPPINSSEALVTYKLLSHSRYAYDVFTQKRSDAWSYGRSMDVPEAGNVCCIEAESDDIRSWAEEAIRYFAAHRDDYDIVMTRSMPPECHQAGLRIKKRFPKVKWIASFGDPIKTNPYQHMNCELYSPNESHNLLNRNRGLAWRMNPKRILLAGAWLVRHNNAVRRRRYLAKIEEDTLRLADRILFNNRAQMRWMLGDDEHLLKKAHLVRHTYEPELYPDAAGQTRTKLRFVFIGHLDELRTAMPLLQGVRALMDEKPDLAQRAEFLFYGDMADGDLAYLVKHHMLDLVQYCDPVPYLESLAVMRDADWVMHMDANISDASDENIFFAAKLADYFGSGSNLLAVTMPRGDVADVLRASGAQVLNFSANEIKQALYLMIYEGHTAKPDPEHIKAFSAHEVAAYFDAQVVATLYEG